MSSLSSKGRSLHLFQGSSVRGWVSPTNLGDQLVVPTAPIRLFGSPDC
jgi:hypothetical protein